MRLVTRAVCLVVAFCGVAFIGARCASSPPAAEPRPAAAGRGPSATASAPAAPIAQPATRPTRDLSAIQYLVVIFLENRSFVMLYGSFP
jgi:phospholipase C